MKLKRESIAARLDKGYLDATSFMEYLIRRGVPQRTAHGVVGRLVRKGIETGRALAEFPLEELREACDLVVQNKGIRLFGFFAFRDDLIAYQVRFQIESWKKKLAL